MRTFTSAADRLASQRLLKACTAIIDQYRKEVGHLPEWLHELEATDALKLLAASGRMGMKLPTHETLTTDQRERERANTRAINHGLRKQS
jgi:hypothetical protein